MPTNARSRCVPAWWITRAVVSLPDPGSPTSQTGAVVWAASRVWAANRSAAGDTPASRSKVNAAACRSRRAMTAAGILRSAAGTGSPTTVTNPTTPSGPSSPASGANDTSHHGGPVRLGGAGRRALSGRPASASGVWARAAASGVLCRRAEQTMPRASARFVWVSPSQAGLAYRSRRPLPSTNTGVLDWWKNARHGNDPDPRGRPLPPGDGEGLSAMIPVTAVRGSVRAELDARMILYPDAIPEFHRDRLLQAHRPPDVVTDLGLAVAEQPQVAARLSAAER